MKSQVKRIGQTIVVIMVMLSLGFVVVQAQDERPRLRVVNASLGLPSADVYVGDTLYFHDVFFGYISNYVPVDPANLRLAVRPAGVKDVDPIRDPRDFAFEINKDYTMVILGTVDIIDNDPWIYEDNLKEPLPPGQARVRMVHAASNPPTIELCLDNQCKTVAKRKFSDYITLSDGTYNLKIRLIGTPDLVIYKLPITFRAGEVYSIFVFDPKQGEVKPRIIPHTDTGQTLPHYPEESVSSRLPPNAPGRAPRYPPVTGAFLSPTALGAFILISLTFAIAGVWVVRRQLTKT